MSKPKPDNGNEEPFESTRTHARTAAEAAREFRESVGGFASEWQEKARGVQKEIEGYVRAHPTKSILAAAGIGFVLGLLFRR